MKKNRSLIQDRDARASGDTASGADNLNISNNLEQTLDNVTRELGFSPDLKIRKFQIGSAEPVWVAAVFMDGLINTVAVDEFVMGALFDNSADAAEGMPREPQERFQFILDRALELGETAVKDDWNDMMLSLLSGNTIILVDGCSKAIVGGTKGGEWRTVAEPSSQIVIRGPKDSFVESLITNIALIRRRIKSPKLWIEFMKIGSVTNTDVALLYMKGRADDKVVDQVRMRLKKIDIEAVLESSYIEQLIQDKVFTPFPTVYNTERPDVSAANLLEGRVVLIVDGTPFVLVVPTVLAQFLQSTDDYTQRFDSATLMRLVRYMSLIILLLGPSVYIALTTFHYEMVPTPMLISLLAQRENVPFPAAIEAMIMEAAFEILREAGIRMPRAVGQTVSIVGALILGTAVVEAGIITPVMVIVVALTGIASFAIPSYNLAVAGRIIRFGFMVAASMFGFYGITLGLIVLIAHINSLQSFGTPYLAPLSPFSIRGQKDTVIRVPMFLVSLRPNKLGYMKDDKSGKRKGTAGTGKDGQSGA
ncbi:spore germination protein KA [Paenibacillus sophorae]|uniref:Spore germination protein n=1 Tax=Paenibacillus sophorae TaxID=1333845 RepID=A0A1H8JTL5_9BACL|nr:spore germination protein [Paenibacillus sophorae]QWU13482.1 spore germination protein [Paenibacillus sophorae]SEN84080.1 spore germination protein KA [Paenibacillus sophorae]